MYDGNAQGFRTSSNPTRSLRPERVQPEAQVTLWPGYMGDSARCSFAFLLARPRRHPLHTPDRVQAQPVLVGIDARAGLRPATAPAGCWGTRRTSRTRTPAAPAHGGAQRPSSAVKACSSQRPEHAGSVLDAPVAVVAGEGHVLARVSPVRARRIGKHHERRAFDRIVMDGILRRGTRPIWRAAPRGDG